MGGVESLWGGRFEPPEGGREGQALWAGEAAAHRFQFEQSVINYDKHSLPPRSLVLSSESLAVEEAVEDLGHRLGLVESGPKPRSLDSDESQVSEFPDEAADLVLPTVEAGDPPLPPNPAYGHI